MNISEKIKKSWWVILSFVLLLNGFGFIYIGLKHNNKNWIIEGIIYEVPWFFYFLFCAIYGVPELYSNNPAFTVMLLAYLLMLVTIIRSFWVAFKLWNVYDNTEKYALNPTELKNPTKSNENTGSSSGVACCICIIVIFIIFTILSNL